MKRLHAVLFALLLASVFGPAIGGAAEPSLAARKWAVFVGVSEPQNLYWVSDQLYRGGHVSRAGAAQLRCLGMNTVVSLRVIGRDSRYITRAGLNYVHIPSKAWQPDEDQVVAFLRIVTNPNCQPVYLYCYHGSDRTGMMSAAYRVVVQGWTKEEALCEMTAGPFGFNPRWQELVEFVCDMDVERIRCRVGLADQLQTASHERGGNPFASQLFHELAIDTGILAAVADRPTVAANLVATPQMHTDRGQ
jgi:protein tyrosine phosphatase (PTP) superfamily phosphohydrolase (DUF442 family)